MFKKLTETQTKEIIERYKEGKDVPFLSQEYKVTYSTIRYWLKKKSIKIRRGKLKDEQITEIIKKYQKGISRRALSSEYNVGYSTIFNWINNNGHRFKGKKLSNNETIELVNKYTRGNSVNSLVKEYEISRSSVLRWVKRMNIKVRDLSEVNKKYLLDQNYFSKVNSEEKAYWLGFLVADGHVSYKRNLVALLLAAKDKSHLIKFKQAIKTNAPIYERNYKGHPMVNLEVYSQRMAQDLRGFFSCRNQIDLDKRLVNHFIRGYFDGDGSVVLTNEQNKKVLRLCIVGQLVFLNNLRKSLPFQCNNKFFKYENIYQFTMGGTTALKFLEWIYIDSTVNNRMERKYDVFIRYLKLKTKERPKCSELKLNKGGALDEEERQNDGAKVCQDSG